MDSEPKPKLQKTFICASGFNKEGKGQCYPQGSRQANKIPEGKRTECSVFPNKKCQEREIYIDRMTKILQTKLEMINQFNTNINKIINGDENDDNNKKKGMQLRNRVYGRS